MMRRNLWAMIVVLALLGGAQVMAQEPAGPPKPGPEHERLAYYVGKWNGAGELKPGPMGPGGEMTWTETCEWFAGGFAIVCNTDFAGAMGEAKGHSVIAYNAGEKTYVFFGIDSNGMVDTSKGSVEGNVWNWAGEGKMGGKLYKMRYSITETSKDAYTFKFEMSGDGGETWASVMEGTSNRAK